MKLQMNAYAWLAEPSRALADFGTYQATPYQPVQFPRTGNGSFWQQKWGGTPAPGVRGIIGAHSSYTDGKGSVTDYVKAAQAAGLSFLVFTDPLEKLTAETLGKLKADCAAASGPNFYAGPGLEFTDGNGDRWIVPGEKIQYPAATCEPFGRPPSEPLWDGSKILEKGSFIINNWMPNALLDYSQFRARGHHPENMCWFWNHLPLAYDRDKLIADNSPEYLFGLRDLRWTAPISFTRITDPADVALAAQTCFTGFGSLAEAREAFTTASSIPGRYVSQGPVLAYWNAMGTQANGEWPHNDTTEYARFKFVARSADGIAEVRVHDADGGLLRRFAGDGAQELTREFILCHDRQHYPVLEIVDTKGRRAFSRDFLVFDYKYALQRCGDNLNILCSTVPPWHPDRLEMLPLVDQFANGELLSINGWDRGGPMCPLPGGSLPVVVNTKEFGQYPPPPGPQNIQPQKLMDVVLASQNIQIARMEINKLATTGYCMKNCATDTGDMTVFERTHTMIAPASRQDMKVCWDYRRVHESLDNYRGAILWHEGEIRFKQDVTLVGAVPIPLAQMQCPLSVDGGLGTTLAVLDAAGGPETLKLTAPQQPLKAQGRIKPGGYIAELPTPVGYLAFFAPSDTDFAYQVRMPWNGTSGSVLIGLGRDGQVVKAGTVLKYRFAVATLADPQLMGPEGLAYTATAMNFGGGLAGYPVQVKTGQVQDATFFFTASAQDHEAVFSLGPKRLLVELPIRVQGVEDNGCVAVYSTKRPWFRFVPAVQETAWFQEDIDAANELWVGNLFVCDNPAVRLTAVVEDLPAGMKPFLEVHNPTDKEIVAQVHSPAHTPRFGGMSARLTLPPGDSRIYQIDNHQFTPAPPA
jgi:hypothetical protein